MILAFQLILSLSILIILHELGHFIPARLFKIRVEKFYLFFDPWFSLIKKKKGDTEYGIGWLPLGGYVKIAGMVDESMDKDAMALPPQDWEFRAKPAWQRLIVMMGGVIVNMIVGFVLYAIILGVWGRDVLPVENVKFGVHVNETMEAAGFQEGDKILALNGERPESFSEVNKALLVDNISTVTIERDGQKMDISIPANIGQQLVDGGVKTAPFSVRLPCVVDSVVAGNKAAEAGLVKGDSVVGLGDVHSIYFNDIKAELNNKKGQTVPLWVKRNGQEVQLNVGINDDGTIGFIPKADVKQFGVETLHYGFFAAIPAGAAWAWETFTDYGSQLKYLFSSSGAKQVGGFGSFAKMFPDTWDWSIFWERTAFISLILAFMNMLPIPALDGGHVMFLLWEMITGRAVSQKILEKAQVVGMVLLLGLMLWGNILDIFRAVVGK